MEIKYKKSIQIITILLVGVFLGWLLFGGGSSNDTQGDNAEVGHEEHTTWTCSMHPQIRQSEPGDCPLCGMALIALSQDDQTGDPALIIMSDYAQKLANVQTMIVGAQTEAGKIRLNGKVTVDERRASVQSSHIAGRVEQLMVNFTGEKVSRGQGIAKLYSPELMTAQKELLQAYAIRESNPALFEAAKERLKRWKISDRQISTIIEQQQASDQFTIYADLSGIVTEKLVELGDYIERGAPIYEIANLQKLWVQFDAYERTIGLIKQGSVVRFTIASLPGETFEGTVSFVDPLLNNQTRVSTARVEVDNSDGRLKPGMFATGIIEVPSGENQAQISVPKSAVLWTGERSIVYVKQDGGFKLRSVVLGPTLGESYVIKEGLESGEQIVVNGTFTVDAAAQLAGKPSMMTPKEEMGTHAHENDDLGLPKVEDVLEISQANQEALNEVLSWYLKLKDALVEDDFSSAKNFTTEFWNAVKKVDSKSMNSKAQESWSAVGAKLEGIEKMDVASDIDTLRAYFEKISELMIYTFSSYKLGMETIYVQHCPMANSDLGANWLSREKQVMNPYFGAQMLFCGEVVKEIN